MEKKEKVISARITTEVSNILDIICEREGSTKNKVVSDLITEKYNKDRHLHTISPLEMVLLKIEHIVDYDYEECTKTYTPRIIIADDKSDIGSEYFGKLQILVGDDTCIREKDDKFYVYDFNDMKAEPLLLTEKEILDFYKGQQDAYDVPSIDEESYQYMRGYYKIMSSFAKIIERELIEYKKNI